MRKQEERRVVLQCVGGERLGSSGHRRVTENRKFCVCLALSSCGQGLVSIQASHRPCGYAQSLLLEHSRELGLLLSPLTLLRTWE